MLNMVIFADSGLEMISAGLNSIKVTLNGKTIEADNLLYDGRTYVQLHTITDMIGADLTWDGDTRTAGLITEVSEIDMNKMDLIIDGYKDPYIDYSLLGLSSSKIKGIAVESSVSGVSLDYSDNGFTVNHSFNANETLKVSVMAVDQTIEVTLKTSGTADLSIGENPKAIYMPADPSKGFNFPYYIWLPSQYKYDNPISTKKKFLIVDTANFGFRGPQDQLLIKADEAMNNGWVNAIDHARQFGYPMMMPVFARSGVSVNQESYGNTSLYEHALDRASVYVKELTTSDSNASFNIKSYESEGYDYKLYYDLDEQLVAMFDDAITQLNKSGYGLEDRVILDGYSASGTLTDRLSYLQPEAVAMVISGATLDDAMLPMTSLKGETINYPIGLGDYTAITGKTFNMETHNSVAKLLYMGKDDTNNTVGYSDCYFEEGNNQMKRLFTNNVLTRAQEIMAIYGDTGAHGMLILDAGIKHSSSQSMNDYVIEFIKSNANADTVVYPKPTSSSLEYTLYE